MEEQFCWYAFPHEPASPIRCALLPDFVICPGFRTDNFMVIGSTFEKNKNYARLESFFYSVSMLT